MKYREACELSEYCRATMINCKYLGSDDIYTTHIDDVYDSDSIRVHLSTRKVLTNVQEDERIATFINFKPALAYAQSLFVWRELV